MRNGRYCNARRSASPAVSTTSRAPRAFASAASASNASGRFAGVLPLRTSVSLCESGASFSTSASSAPGVRSGPLPLKAVSTSSSSFTLMRVCPAGNRTKSAGQRKLRSSDRNISPLSPATKPIARVSAPRRASTSETFTPLPPGSIHSHAARLIVPSAAGLLRRRK